MESSKSKVSRKAGSRRNRLGANDSCPNEPHSEDTILCSCGYEKQIEITSRLDWDRPRIEKEWSLWNKQERKIYKGFRTFALVHTDDRLLAARFAAERVCEKRRGERFFCNSIRVEGLYTAEQDALELTRSDA
jgi:hypothetical protein